MLTWGQVGSSAPLSQQFSSGFEESDCMGSEEGKDTERLGTCDSEEECADLEFSLKKGRVRAI